MSRMPGQSSTRVEVSTAAELIDAAADAGARDIIVTGDLSQLPTVRLSPGSTLAGATSDTVLRFEAGRDGLELSTDNEVTALRLVVDADRRALFNDTGVEDLGRLVLRNLQTIGTVHLLARDRVRRGHVEADQVDVLAADARGFADGPRGYGVEVVAGAFTLWNQQPERDVLITADLTGLTAGRSGAPVRGSGIFVAGAGNSGGRLVVRRLETGAVFSDGGIPPGTPQRISGGVFVVSGALVDRVSNHGPVTTYGPNDMVLDNWGTVHHWVAEDKVTSFGPSGVGFVNFGSIDRLQVNAPIETFGQGARGFNVYEGTLNTAEFERIVTHGDGAVGIQISQPVGEIKVRRGIETHGGVGDSLVKGVVMKLPAIALSVRRGASARTILIAGGLIVRGEGVVPLELSGPVDALHVERASSVT
jgi:hypothetical protein